MREHPLDPEVKEIWKKYPLRLSGKGRSECCNEPTVLVQSMEGGFVTRNCPKCGTSKYLSLETFRYELDLWVSCPLCKKPMDPTQGVMSNYVYECEPCDIVIKLASLLPRWSDIR